MMGMYRKKPVVIVAQQWDGTPESAKQIVDWVNSSSGNARYVQQGVADPNCPSAAYHETHRYCPTCPWTDDPDHLVIQTLEGQHRADPRDQIIQGVADEFYPCKPNIFEQTYEEVT